MAFPTDGSNHKKAVESERNLDLYKEQIENQYSKKVSKILTKGGTTTKTDNIIIFNDGSSINASLKNKKNIKTGSFDYVNTSNFDWKGQGFSKSLEIYNEFKCSGNTKGYDLLKKSISEQLQSMTDEVITEFFIKNVIDKYKNLELLVINEIENRIYCSVIPPAFKLIIDGGKLSLKKTTGTKMSYKLIGIDSNGNKIDINLRIRIHLNNGQTKWLTDGSSVLVIKFQQDSVYKMLK